ncbi:MAG: hypothetical protein R2716_00400 [Microthrixaceae bacterium]
MNLVGLAVDLTGLTVVGLGLILLALLTVRPAAIAIGVYAAVQLGAYALYPYHGISYGPRFLFEVAPLLVVLCALGITSVPRFDARAAGIVALAAVVSLAVIVPTRSVLFHERGEYLQLPEVPAGSVVLVARGEYEHPDTFLPAFVRNGADPLGADVLYLRDEAGGRCELLGPLGDRPAYTWDPDTRRVRGPLETC